MTDQYDWWRSAIAGRHPEIHADHPQPGFYKMRNGKGGDWLPVAIWAKDGALVARVGAEMREPATIWTWCAHNPIAKDIAKQAFETGAFPGDIGHNSGDLTLSEEIEEAVEDALSWLDTSGVTDNVAMDTAANHRSRLQGLAKRADAEREEMVRPLLDEQKAINGFYRPLIENAEGAAKRIRDALSKYMAAEEEKARRAAAEKARIENERRLEEYRRQQEEAERNRINEPVELPVMVAPEPVKVQAGGQRGRKAGLREVPRYAITDYAAALAHAKDHRDVIAAVEKVCFAQARAGAEVPGVTKTIEKVAV